MFFPGILKMTTLVLLIKTGSVAWNEIQIDTSAFTSDIYPEPVFDNDVFEGPVFAPDDIDVPDYDSPTKVNLLDVGTMHDYWSRNPDVITVNAADINKDDPTAVRGQFDSGVDATVTN